MKFQCEEEIHKAELKPTQLCSVHRASLKSGPLHRLQLVKLAIEEAREGMKE